MQRSGGGWIDQEGAADGSGNESAPAGSRVNLAEARVSLDARVARAARGMRTWRGPRRGRGPAMAGLYREAGDGRPLCVGSRGPAVPC